MDDRKTYERIEALIHRKHLNAKRDCRPFTEQALAELLRLIVFIGPDAQYLPPSKDVDVLAVLEEKP